MTWQDLSLGMSIAAIIIGSINFLYSNEERLMTQCPKCYGSMLQHASNILKIAEEQITSHIECVLTLIIDEHGAITVVGASGESLLTPQDIARILATSAPIIGAEKNARQL